MSFHKFHLIQDKAEVPPGKMSPTVILSFWKDLRANDAISYNVWRSVPALRPQSFDRRSTGSNLPLRKVSFPKFQVEEWSEQNGSTLEYVTGPDMTHYARDYGTCPLEVLICKSRIMWQADNAYFVISWKKSWWQKYFIHWEASLQGHNFETSFSYLNSLAKNSSKASVGARLLK